MAIRIRNPAPLSLLLFFSTLLFSAATSFPDPIRARADLLRKQLTDLSYVSSLYAASSRKLSLETSKQSRLFSQLSHNFSTLLSSNPPRDALRFEKDSRALISSARALISGSKDSFDPQIKIQRLKDAIFAANEQLTKVNNCSLLF
jgi:alpha-1,4-galacturonosyltransferase